MTHQQSKFLNLMSGYADSVDLYNQSLESAGTTQAKYNLWLEGTEAKVQGAKVAMESFWLNFYDSKTMGGILTGFTGLINVLDKFASKVGGINAVAPLIGMLSTFTKFSPTKLFEGIDESTGKATKGIKVFGMELGTLGKDFKTVTSARAKFVEATKEGTQVEINGTTATSKSNAMRLALTDTTTGLIIKQVALNAVISLGVGLLISGVAFGLSKIVNGARDAQKEVEQLMTTLPQKNKEVMNETKLVDRFKELTNATSLNKEEGAELLNLQRKLAEIFPQTANGIDKEGNMITTNTQLVTEQLEAKRALLKLENEGLAMKAQQQLPKLEEELAQGKARLEEVNRKIREKEYLGKGAKNASDRDSKGDSFGAKWALDKEQDKLSKSLMKTTESVNVYKNALNVMDVIHNNEIRTVANKNAKYKENKIVTQELREELKNQGYEEASITKALANTGNAMSDKSDKAIDLANANIGVAYSEEESQKAFAKSQAEVGKASENIQFYSNVLKELNTGKGITADIVQKITSDYPQLLGYLDDETVLREKINHLIDKEADVQKESYAIMMQNDETYYNEKIKYNVDVQNAVSKLAQDFVGAFSGSYEVDLKNFKNLAQAKAAILKRMDDKIVSVNNKIADLAENSTMGGNDLMVDIKMDAHVKRLEKQREQFSTGFDDITANFSGYSGLKASSGNLKGGDGTPKAKKGAKGEKEKKAKEDIADLEILIDRYANLNSQLSDVNYYLDRNNQKQDLAKDWDKIKLLEEQNELYKQRQNLLNDMWKEQQQAKLETSDKLWNAGFSLKNGEITNLKSNMEAWVSWANSATGDTKKERQDQVKALDQATKDYATIYNSISDTNKQWYEQGNLIEKAKEEILQIKVALENTKIDGITNNFDNVKKLYEDSVADLELQKAVLDNAQKDTSWVLNQKLDLSQNKIRDIENYLKSLKTIDLKTEEAQKRVNDLYKDGTDQLRQQKMASEALKAELLSRKQEELSTIESVEAKLTDIIKKEAEKQRQIIEDSFNKRIDFVNKTKDLLSKQNREEDFGKDLSVERMKLEEMRRELNNAMLDTSDMGKLRLKQLQQEFNDQQEKINDMMKNHERTLNSELLDEQIKDLEKLKEKELKAYDETWSDDRIASIVKKAMFDGFFTDVEGNIKTLTQTYLDFANEFENGTSMAGERLKKEFIDNLEKVKGLMGDINDLWKGYDLAPTNSFVPNNVNGGNSNNKPTLPSALLSMNSKGLMGQTLSNSSNSNALNFGNMVEFNIGEISDLSDKTFMEKLTKFGDIIYSVTEKNLKEALYKG